MARKVRKVDPAYLERVALWYIERWDGPTSALRRALMRRVHRSVQAYDTHLDEATVWVEEVIRRVEAAGLVSDARVADRIARQGRAKGWSARRLRSKLMEKQIDRELADAALCAADQDVPQPERLAALRLARRRRLGPWRDKVLDDDVRRRELGVFARNGFSYAIASSVVALNDPEAADDELLSH